MGCWKTSIVLATMLVLGCGARSVRIGDDDVGTDGDTDVDGDTDTDTGTGIDPCEDPHAADVNWDTASDEVDLLVMVDNSNSMREEQASLTANMPSVLHALTNPPDDDGDGFPDFAPVGSVHVGVVSSDMGTSGYPVTTCNNAERGDDGVLQHLPSASVPDCDPVYPTFLTYDARFPDEDIDKAFECIATLGTGGCGFEQQLYAVEKALTVHAADGAANEGFLRRRALLAVLIVTDEEDCSVQDPRIFGDDDALGPLNIRCFNNPEMVRPVDEFVGSLLGIKPGRPDRVVVAGIVGVPTDIVALSDAEMRSYDIQSTRDFDDILGDPRMQEVVDYSPEGGGNRLVPSCDIPGLGVAYPPRRIVELIREVDRAGNSGLVQSICQQDWTRSMRAFRYLVQHKLESACLRHPLVAPNGVPLSTREHADCVVRETLAHAGSCGPGKFEAGTDDGRTVCQVCQLGDGIEPHLRDYLGNDLSQCAGQSEYWFYTMGDEVCGEMGKVEFTPGAMPVDGSRVRIRCTDTTLPAPPGCEE